MFYPEPVISDVPFDYALVGEDKVVLVEVKRVASSRYLNDHIDDFIQKLSRIGNVKEWFMKIYAVLHLHVASDISTSCVKALHAAEKLINFIRCRVGMLVTQHERFEERVQKEMERIAAHLWK
jgi:flavodoxin